MNEGLQATVGVTRPDFALDVELRVAPGETVAVLGPNGAGKTTLLRALAGLEQLSRGRIVLDATVLEAPTGDGGGRGAWVEPEDRSVGLVFQEHALFAHLSALDNVAFGLRWGQPPRLGRSEARERAMAWLERFGVADRADARPGQLSGGQAQRVALARSLAPSPRLLLLDEPLAALDASTRPEVRRQLRDHLADHRGARLLVTHDPVDAFALADRLLVLESGRVSQVGTPAEIVSRPGSRYVADLVGVNLWWAVAVERSVVELVGGGRLVVGGPGVATAGSPVGVTVHPRAVALHRRRPEGSPRNVWSGMVSGVELIGDRVRVRVTAAADPREVVAEVTPEAAADLGLEAGTPVWVSVKASELEVFPA